MLKFANAEIAKEMFYAPKNLMKIWDVNVDNVVISIFVKPKTNSKYWIIYLDKDITPLFFV